MMKNNNIPNIPAEKFQFVSSDKKLHDQKFETKQISYFKDAFHRFCKNKSSVVAAIKGERDIAIGNVVGSNIFNILGIIGIAPLVAPLGNYSINAVDLGVMLAASVGLMVFMRTGWKVSRWEGALMLLAYCGYTAYLICNHV